MVMQVSCNSTFCSIEPLYGICEEIEDATIATEKTKISRLKQRLKNSRGQSGRILRYKTRVNKKYLSTLFISQSLTIHGDIDNDG